MPRLPSKIALAAFAVALTSGIAAAQQAPANPAKADSKASTQETLDKTWDETKAMTRKQWNSAKKKWASEKVKWSDCNRQADAQKLETPKSWSFVASCMTKT